MNANELCCFCDPAWEHICREVGFSDCEGKIFRMVFQDMKVRRIARILGIAPRTVNDHIHRVYRRLGIGGRMRLLMRVFAIYVAWFLREGPPPGCRYKAQP